MTANVWIWSAGLVLSLIGAPLLPGIVNRTKAFFAGRRGPSVFQLYRDLAKLLRRGGVFSTASRGVLALAPCASLAVLLTAAVLLPHFGCSSPLALAGDAVLFFYLLGTSRMTVVLAALDSGSSFEGMGASREVQFSALVEAAVFGTVCFVFFAFRADSLSAIAAHCAVGGHAVSRALIAIAFFIVLLAENCRVPVDDPDTHLELTMIHEAMILDYSGPDLALIHYAASLKLWMFSVLLAALTLPTPLPLAFQSLWFAVGVLLTGVMVGVAESCMARLRFLKVPHILLGALGLVLFGLFLRIFFEKGV